MRQGRHREVKGLTLGNTATEWQSGNSGAFRLPPNRFLKRISNSTRITCTWRHLWMKMILPSGFSFLLFFPLPWTLKKVSTLPRRPCGHGLKYNKSLNNQKNKVLHSKFQEKVIKLQCFMHPFCTGFQKWATSEHWHERFAGLMLHFPVSWYFGGQMLSTPFSELLPCVVCTAYFLGHALQYPKLISDICSPRQNI